MPKKINYNYAFVFYDVGEKRVQKPADYQSGDRDLRRICPVSPMVRGISRWSFGKN